MGPFFYLFLLFSIFGQVVVGAKNIVAASCQRTNTQMLLHDRTSLRALDAKSWERQAFQDFEVVVADKSRLFPCTLGVAGLAANQLRFHFIEQDPSSAAAASRLAAALQSYVPCARTFGKNTSLVVVFRQSRDLGVEVYESIFWGLLNALHRLDSRPWPSEIPTETEHERWEFSFAGEPLFVVCNTPSHKLRLSRHAGNFMLTFQPRWVFDEVIGPQAPHSARIKNEIRRRLAAFDAVPPSLDLGAFGEDGNREWKQYFLPDSNQPRAAGCPFHKSSGLTQPHVISTSIRSLERVVGDLLPPTGAVEVQRDTPWRVHALHRHPVHETLHVIEGCIEFQVGGSTFRCGPGDRLLLPAETPHSSRAGEEGCLYVIAARIVMPVGDFVARAEELVDVE